MFLFFSKAPNELSILYLFGEMEGWIFGGGQTRFRHDKCFSKKTLKN